MYDSPRFKLMLKQNRSTLSKTNSLPFILSSNLSRYFSKRDSKNSSIISSASLPCIISMLLILECIVRVSSEYLEEIKLIAVAN